MVFREQEMADRAMQELRDFSLFGKKLVKTYLTRWVNRKCNMRGV